MGGYGDTPWGVVVLELTAQERLLGYIGAKPAEGTYVIVGRLATIWYFVHFLIILPVLSVVETPRPLPQSISQPIFSAAGGGLAGAMSAPKEKVE